MQKYSPLAPSTAKRQYSGKHELHEPRHDKTNKMSVSPAKTQMSLGIRPVWSESSLPAWRKLGSLATHWAHSEDSDQTGRMPRQIWVVAGRTLIMLVLSCRGLRLCINWPLIKYIDDYTVIYVTLRVYLYFEYNVYKVLLFERQERWINTFLSFLQVYLMLPNLLYKNNKSAKADPLKIRYWLSTWPYSATDI